jgi:hypothetical protein
MSLNKRAENERAVSKAIVKKQIPFGSLGRINLARPPFETDL